MIVPDVNLLLFAYDSTSPFHAKAAAWWQACLTGPEPVGLPHVVAFGFVRVATNARVFDRPLTAAEAAGHVHTWLRQPVLRLLDTSIEQAEMVLQMFHNLGTAGNLVTDAQIAAAAIEHNAVVHTADADFARFPGVRWLNPITGIGSRYLRKPTDGEGSR